MPNTFKNVLYEVTSTNSVFYTCPAATTGIVIGLQATNKVGTGVVALDLSVDDGVDEEPMLNDASLPIGASLSCVAGKLVLEAGDTLKAKTGTTGDIALVMSILEIS